MSRQAELREIETRAHHAESRIASKTGRDATLTATIDAAELYLQALRLTDDAADKRRVRVKCRELLRRAELLKDPESVSQEDLTQPESTRELSTKEKIIILEGSKLNGFIFKPWETDPSLSDFTLREGERPFLDSPELPLSEFQMGSFAAWERPREALSRIEISNGGRLLPNHPTMEPIGKIDLVQDMTSDCSVVASLCAGTARAERGHPKILRTIVYPYDLENQRPLISGSGKYVLRLRFNGCWRRVEIDDRLPASNTDRVLHVIDRSNPGLLWPALVEKAYLKVRGGYDFPGSNSGTDLAVLTGWVPQQIFLHDEEVEPNSLWTTIYRAFNAGDLLLTMGTGKLPEREQRVLGLAAEHDYAVLAMIEDAGHREMLVKNPWADGDVWRGTTRRRPNPSHDSMPAPLSRPSDVGHDESEYMIPGTFWMDFSSVFQHFENLYVNWNPSLFSQRQDIHFSWDLSKMDRVSNVLIDNPQFTIRTAQRGEVWLLLNRHFKTGHYSQATQGRNGYISLYIYDRKGSRILSSDGAKIRGPFVDSPTTLLVFDLPSGGTYTAVVASQDLAADKYNFTLSTFSNMDVSLREARTKYPYELSLPAAWTRSTAGGNSDASSYLINPQFMLRVEHEHDVGLLLRIENPTVDHQTDVNVKLIVVKSDGKRLIRLRPRDIVASSGDYRRASAVIESQIPKGSYTVICSTFERGQCAKFVLTLLSSSSQATSLQVLPGEESGRLRMTSSFATLDGATNRLVAPITLLRNTKAIFIAKSKDEHEGFRASQSTALFKLTLEQGQGPYKNLIASSVFGDTEFSTLASGVRIEDTYLQPTLHGPGTGGLWLVLERMTPLSPREIDTHDLLQVEILTEERFNLGLWGHGEG